MLETFLTGKIFHAWLYHTRNISAGEKTYRKDLSSLRKNMLGINLKELKERFLVLAQIKKKNVFVLGKA